MKGGATMALKTILPNTVIFREGDAGDTFCQVFAGGAQVFLNYGTDQERKLTDLGPGSFFGEIAALGAFRRTATVVSGPSGVTLLEMSHQTLMETFQENPSMVLSLMQQLGRRTAGLSADCEEARAALNALKGVSPAPAAPGLLEKARGVVSRFLGQKQGSEKPTLEQEMADGNYRHVRDGYSAQTFSCDSGTVLYKEGDPGACMYAVHWGHVGVYANYGRENQRLITTLYPDSFFGELGMLCGMPRTATVVVLEDETTLEIIKPEDIAMLFSRNPAKIWMIMDHLIHRLRSLTTEYADVCREICALQQK